MSAGRFLERQDAFSEWTNTGEAWDARDDCGVWAIAGTRVLAAPAGVDHRYAAAS